VLFRSGFREWLATASSSGTIPGLVAHFSFDELAGTNQFANLIAPTNLSTALQGNTVIPGRSGQAIRFNGDDEISFPNLLGHLEPWEQYSVNFWVEIPAALTNVTIFHRCEGTDVGFHGTELGLDQGRLRFVIKRFWPGNAIAVRSWTPIPTARWIQITVAYDGSAQAEGMKLFVDGEPLKCEIIRNHLYKSPENSRTGLSFGA